MLIEFKVNAASFQVEYGDPDFAIETKLSHDKPLPQPESWFCLQYKVTTEFRLPLKSGAKLSEMNGLVRLTSNAEWKNGDKTIGVMWVDGWTKYFIKVDLPKLMFDRLYESAIRGHFPQIISIGIRHSEHLTSDGWNSDNYNLLGIISIEFNGQIAEAK